jgi:hypothetical protein
MQRHGAQVDHRQAAGCDAAHSAIHSLAADIRALPRQSDERLHLWISWFDVLSRSACYAQSGSRWQDIQSAGED